MKTQFVLQHPTFLLCSDHFYLNVCKQIIIICLCLLVYLFYFLCVIISFLSFFFIWIIYLKLQKKLVAYSDKSACSIASGGSGSIGGNSTATLGNDLPSLTASEDFPEEIEFSTNYGKALQTILKQLTNFDSQ